MRILYNFINKINQLETNKEQFKIYLSALKVKISDIEFVIFDDYIKEPEIGEGSSSSVKIVVKKQNYSIYPVSAKKILKNTHYYTFIFQ